VESRGATTEATEVAAQNGCLEGQAQRKSERVWRRSL